MPNDADRSVPRTPDPPLAEPVDTTSSGIAGMSSTRAPGAANHAEFNLSFLSPPQAPDELGRLGGYRILRVLGQGGMGMVLDAEDVKLKRHIAIKVMKPDVAIKEAHRQRFLREAQAAAAVEHPHIIPILQIGEENGVPFIAMPFLKGEPLDQRMDRGRLSVSEIVTIGRQMAEALAVAHEQGLIHRDIKPGNTWLEEIRGAPGTISVRLLDFGLARLSSDEARLTQSGAILGTPAYMAPEQARAQEVDHRADLFSLGAVLYEMATGKRPFTGHDAMSIITSLALDAPTAPIELNPDLPPVFSALIMRLLEKDPAKRPQTANDVAEVLRRLQPEKTVVVIASRASAAAPDPWSGIDGSDYTNPDSALAASRSADGAGLRKRPVLSSPSTTEHSRNPARWALFGIIALALLIGGFFALRALNKDGPKPEAKVAKVPKQEPREIAPPKKIPPSSDVEPPELNETNAAAVQRAWAAKLNIPLEAENKLGMKLMLIPPGAGVDRAFYLGKYEVTQGEWQKVMGSNPSEFGAKNAKVGGKDTSLFPVEKVNWFDSVEFCNKLSEREGLKPYYELTVKNRDGSSIDDAEVTILGGSGYHIPTDAEWTQSCTAGTKTKYHFGDKDEDLPEYAWFNGNSGGRTHAVGEKKPNAFDLYDMHGNVREWNEEMLTNKDTGASERVNRGGNWAYTAGLCAVSNRNRHPPVYRTDNIGVRVARVPLSEAPVTKGPEVSFDLGNGVKLDVVKINAKGKTFLMGSPKDEAGRSVGKEGFDPEEQHEVTFGHDYFMGKFEVTQEQYEAVMGMKPSKSKGANSPVGLVSWNDAQKFCKRLNENFNEQKVAFRLPSEAEWEYACRAGTTMPFSFGKTLEKAQAHLTSGSPTPVGSYPPNAFGLYDMHGNLWEWCDDFYGPYSKAPRDGTAQGTRQSPKTHPVRGGSFSDPASACRSAQRNWSVETDKQFPNVGFRVVVDIADDSPVLPKKDPPVVKGPEVSFDLGNGVKLDVVNINAKGKKFLMGSPKEEKGRKVGMDGFDPEEQHEVTFGHDFYMGRFEVTQEQYEAVTGNKPSKFPGAKNPVEMVSWTDAQEFCRKLNEKFKDRKVKFRLPSEAEWEYACRAGTMTAFHFGKTLGMDQANFGNQTDASTKAVGSYEPNAFGLFDMHGNVCEWCLDYYGPYMMAPKDGTVQSNMQPKQNRHVLRGGSFCVISGDCRSAFRKIGAPGSHSDDSGIRVAVDIADDSPVLPPKK